MQKYYYCKNGDGKPVVTVCVMQNGSDTARGVAILSSKDNHNKKIARQIAAGRAAKALRLKNNNSEIRRGEPVDAIVSLHLAECGAPEFYRLASDEWWKSYANPRLTDFERRLLAPAKAPVASESVAG